jgi:hypothetical protein
MGALQIPDLTWTAHEAAIRRAVCASRTLHLLTARKGDRYLAARHWAFVHPEFDEVDAEGLIPLYECDLSIGSGGGATRGQMRRILETE